MKEISCDIPYHSHYLTPVETQLLFNLNKVIPQPKKRSPRWISTSVPCIEWSNTATKLSSANYHTRSILNTVLFKQATKLIPINAVTIEIAPDGILQHILKESLHSEVTNIVLTQRTENVTNVTMRGIGKLYNCGLQPQIVNLYPPVKFPVSRGTPMISPSIRYIRTMSRKISLSLSSQASLLPLFDHSLDSPFSRSLPLSFFRSLAPFLPPSLLFWTLCNK